MARTPLLKVLLLAVLMNMAIGTSDGEATLEYHNKYFVISILF